MKTKRAISEDNQEIIELLQNSQLPSEDIDLKKQDFFILEKEGVPVALCAVEIYESDALLRSFAVVDKFRGKGLGFQIYIDVLDYLVKREVKSVFLLTTTAESWFERYGWMKIKREAVPSAIKETSEFKSVCPGTAVCMQLNLNNLHIFHALKDFHSRFFYPLYSDKDKK